MEKFLKFVLRLLGWKIEGKSPQNVSKMLIIEAPHTSNWDYFYGMICIYSEGIKVNVVIKKELFFWPLGPILKILGGIPIDRSKSSSKVDALAALFQDREVMRLAITPEGTRSLSTQWKKGFYYVAVKAGVPILLTALDYKTKTGRFGGFIYPTGNYEEDLKKIENFYRGMGARYPEKFNLS